MVLKSAMSPSSNRAYSTASVMYPTLPCWKSLIEAFEGRGDPFSTNGGFQGWILEERSCPQSTMDPSLEDLVWPILATLAPFWGLAFLVGKPLPSSTTSLPLGSRFVFLSAGSTWEAWKGGGVGGLVWMATWSALPPAWDSRSSKRLVLALRCSTVASGTLAASWMLLT